MLPYWYNQHGTTLKAQNHNSKIHFLNSFSSFFVMNHTCWQNLSTFNFNPLILKVYDHLLVTWLFKKYLMRWKYLNFQKEFFTLYLIQEYKMKKSTINYSTFRRPHLKKIFIWENITIWNKKMILNYKKVSKPVKINPKSSLNPQKNLMKKEVIMKAFKSKSISHKISHNHHLQNILITTLMMINKNKTKNT